VANHGRLPADFVALVDACLEPQRSQRPSIGEVLATLRAKADDEKLVGGPDSLTADRS
jgi:hypothetical protein